MKGYAALIAEATGGRDPETVALVETLMREETGSVLDHLSAARFAALARQAYADAQASRPWPARPTPTRRRGSRLAPSTASRSRATAPCSA